MSKLKSNFIYNAVYQVLVLIIPFVTMPYISRTIGVAGVGTYSFTYSIVCYFMMFALLGMNNYGNREVAKNKSNREKLDKTFSSIYFFQIITTIIVFLVYLIYIFLFYKQYFMINCIQSLYILSVAFDINWFFCGLQEFKITITRSGIIRIVTLLLIFMFVKRPSDLWKYIAILSSMTLLNQLVLWPFLKGKVRFVKVNFREIKRHIKPTFILFIPVLAVSMYKIMDKIMIGGITSISEVAYYENAEKMINVVMQIVLALGTVTLPEMTHLFNTQKLNEYNRILYKSMSIVSFIVFPAIFGLLATSKDLVSVYLGNDFLNTYKVLNILSLSLIFTSLASIIRMQLLIPQHRDKEYTISVVCGAAINFVLNILLISKFRSSGAAIATLISEFFVFTLQYYYSRKDIQIKKVLKESSYFFIVSIIMYIIVMIIGMFISNIITKLIVQITVGSAIYFLMNISFIKENINFFNRRKKYEKKD